MSDGKIPPYALVANEDESTDDRVYAAAVTSGGVLVRKVTPQEAADFLEAVETFYMQHMAEFVACDFGYSLYEYRTEDIAKMNLPPSMYAHWCPKCEATWPDELIRMEETLEEETFAIQDGQWVTASVHKEDLDSPNHWFHCNGCSEVVDEDAAGRDLEELYEEMLNRSVVRSRGFEDSYAKALDRVAQLICDQQKESECRGENRTPRVEGFLHALEFAQRMVERVRANTM